MKTKQPTPRQLDKAAAGSTWADLAQRRAPIQWDWPGWLPRGYLTILASQPGIGKSSLCLHLAAAYIDGRPWPDGTPPTYQLSTNVTIRNTKYTGRNTQPPTAQCAAAHQPSPADTTADTRPIRFQR